MELWKRKEYNNIIQFAKYLFSVLFCFVFFIFVICFQGKNISPRRVERV